MRAQPTWGWENNDAGYHRCEVAQGRSWAQGGSFGKWSFRKQPTEGQGGWREESQGRCWQGEAFPDILEEVSNPALSAFPLQGEKGGAGSPGLLGLLGQKVGIEELWRVSSV